MSKTVHARLTKAQADALQTSIGCWSPFPSQPDRPMSIESITQVHESPEEYELHAVLADEVDGEWVLKGRPMKLTREKLDRVFRIFNDRFMSMAASLASLNLDDLDVRKDVLTRTTAVIRAALLEEGLEPVGEIAIKLGVGMREIEGQQERIVFPISKITVRRGEMLYELGTPTLPGDIVFE